MQGWSWGPSSTSGRYNVPARLARQTFRRDIFWHNAAGVWHVCSTDVDSIRVLQFCKLFQEDCDSPYIFAALWGAIHAFFTSVSRLPHVIMPGWTFQTGSTAWDTGGLAWSARSNANVLPASADPYKSLRTSGINFGSPLKGSASRRVRKVGKSPYHVSDTAICHPKMSLPQCVSELRDNSIWYKRWLTILPTSETILVLFFVKSWGIHLWLIVVTNVLRSSCAWYASLVRHAYWHVRYDALIKALRFGLYQNPDIRLIVVLANIILETTCTSFNSARISQYPILSFAIQCIAKFLTQS